MPLTYIKPGYHATITAAADLEAGDFVVVGQVLASVVANTIASGQQGGASMVGTHKAPKLAGESWPAGTRLGWDVSEGAVRATFTPVAGDLNAACVAIFDAASAETTCQVLLTPASSTLVT